MTDEDDTDDGRVHPFVATTDEDSQPDEDTGETPFVSCERGVNRTEDTDDVTVSTETFPYPISAGLLPLGVALAAVGVHVALPVVALGLVFVAAGGFALDGLWSASP